MADEDVRSEGAADGEGDGPPPPPPASFAEQHPTDAPAPWEPSEVPKPGSATDEGGAATQEMPADTAAADDTVPGGVGAAAPLADDTLVGGAAGAGAGMAAGAAASEPDTSGVPPEDERRGTAGWVIVLLILALLLGAAGLGFGIYAAHKEAKAGPTGATGAAGATGAQGQRGPQGAQGPAGPAGTVVRPAVTSGNVLTTSPAAGAGTTVTGSTSCPLGKILLSGGAQITVPAASAKDVALQSSFPVNDTTWQVTAVVLTTLPAGEVMTLKPYAFCGVAPATSSTTTTTL